MELNSNRSLFERLWFPMWIPTFIFSIDVSENPNIKSLKPGTKPTRKNVDHKTVIRKLVGLPSGA